MAEPVSEPGDKIERGTWLALIAMALGVFVIANDFTALSVAIPNIEHDLGTSLTTAQWVINGYALVFGVLIVPGGRLADLYGRKRMFMIGATIFSVFSLASGLMPTVELLIAGRALMGVGGALMWPAILGMTYGLLPEDKAGLAGGLILGVAGLGNAIGPLLGGVLTDEFSWRWVFFINLPVTAFAMIVTQLEVTETRAEAAERRIDYRGIAVLSLGLVAVLLALDEGPDVGFATAAILILFAIAAVALVSFVFVERKQGSAALVPSDVLRNPVFAAACATVLLMSAIFFSALLYLPQFFEKVLGFSALGAGEGLLPMMGVYAVTSFVAGGLYNRLGARVVVASGAITLALGMFVLSFLDADSSYASLVPGLVILGIGIGLFYSSITTVGVTALDPSRSSLAGGIIYMCQIAGGAVGLGLNTAIVASQDTLSEGISVAFRVDAFLAVIGFFVVLRFVHGANESTPVPLTASHRHRHCANA